MQIRFDCTCAPEEDTHGQNQYQDGSLQGKDKAGNFGRFNELLQELAAVHASELESQKMSYEEQLLKLSRSSSMGVRSDPTMQSSAMVREISPLSLPGSMCGEGLPAAQYTIGTPVPVQEILVEPPAREAVEPPAPTQPPTYFDTPPHVPNSEERLQTPNKSICERGVNERQTRMAEQIPLDAASKWANLARCAVDIASLDKHIPREVWKHGLLSKHAAKEQIAQDAKFQFEKLTSANGAPKRTVGGHLHKAPTFLMAMAHPTRRNCPNWSNIEFKALDPHGKVCLSWTWGAMFFMCYDMVFLPMQAFEPPDLIVFQVFDMAAQVYWTMDIVVCFSTAIFRDSKFETSFVQIARSYARTWLLFDLLMTLPQWYTLLASPDNAQLSSLKGARFVRILRLLRLVRLAKMKHIVDRSLEVFNSIYVLLIIGIFQNMALLCMFNHFIACIWFAIGTAKGGWVDQENLGGASILYKYLCSMHWTLTQFQGTSEFVPTTTVERAYAVVFLLIALILLSCFTSKITNSMGQLQALHNQLNSEHRAAQAYLNANDISTHLAVQVKKYIDWSRRRNHRKQEAEVLLVLPTRLRMELLEEVRSPVLLPHPLFGYILTAFPRVRRRLCYEGLEEFAPVPGEFVFEEGDQCSHMCFTWMGMFRYEHRSTAIGRVCNARARATMIAQSEENCDSSLRCSRLGPGDWLSEASLWTEWEHRGNLTCLEESMVMWLSASTFAEIAQSSTNARYAASLYARNFVVHLNRFGHTFTDLIDLADLFDADRGTKKRAVGSIFSTFTAI